MASLFPSLSYKKSKKNNKMSKIVDTLQKVKYI